LYGSGNLNYGPLDPEKGNLVFLPQYITVNAAGLAAINSQLGGQISFGYSHLSIGPGGANDLIGFQNRLELTPVPEPTSLAIVGIGIVASLHGRRSLMRR
jgi:hypothetical protein